MSATTDLDVPGCWPSLPLDAWRDTYETLHLWTQIVGKVRLALTPLVNHWWNVSLYVDARGLTTSPIPWQERTFEVRFDFGQHELVLHVSDGDTRAMPLAPRSVADFYAAFMDLLHACGIDVEIWTTPVEIPDPIPFERDHGHASYDRESVERFFRILVTVDRLFKVFRAGFVGKCSPVHFFWGSFDLAVTRFSGQRAPSREGADAVMREAYSHEASSVGFWPGGSGVSGAAFYAYFAPEPAGFATAKVSPDAAYYDPQLGEFLLMYDALREAPSPSEALLEFCRSSYDAGARLAHWDRSALQR